MVRPPHLVTRGYVKTAEHYLCTSGYTDDTLVTATGEPAFRRGDTALPNPKTVGGVHVTRVQENAGACITMCITV